jgi:O-antigen/teichoic acid export membrane protein
VAVWITLPSAAVCAALAVFAGPVLGLFGPEFAVAETALLILLAGEIVNVGTGSVLVLLNVTGHERLAARVCGATALANVALTVAGAWWFGLLGAAAATAATVILRNVWLLALVRGRLSVDSSVLAALGPTAKEERP